MTLLEVLISAAIFLAGLAAIFELLGGSLRAGVSARQLVDAAAFAQSVLEHAARLEPGELPAVPADGYAHTILAAPPLTTVTMGAGPRWTELWTHCDQAARRLAFLRAWTLSARRGASGELVLTLEFSWEAVAGEPASVQSQSLELLANPRTWR